MLVPDVQAGPWDWSPFTPVANKSSKLLTFATSAGMEQFGCCPKVMPDPRMNTNLTILVQRLPDLKLNSPFFNFFLAFFEI